MKSSGELIASINLDMPNNNAGLISAEDVRHNMNDTVFSINRIVASGDTQDEFPFRNNVTIKKNFAGATESEQKGILYVESGIMWEYAENELLRDKLQTEPFLGLGSISHNDLADLTVGDTHTQYASISGHKAGLERAKFTGNQVLNSDYWLNASGYYNTGFRFNPTSADGLTQDIMTSGTFAFEDNSRIANAKGTAKAWCSFSASGYRDGTATDNAPVIYSWHNISGISRTAPGKLKITFASGTFENNDYVVVAHTNGSTSFGSDGHDFHEDAVVGVAYRDGDDGTALRSVTYHIKHGGTYVDAKICELIAYGYEPNETSGTVPNTIKDAAYNPAG